MSQIKRQWCAMLAKLTAPMDAETAAKAFVDMLPMLPPDDALYTRQTLDRAATCERKTAVPTFADLSRVLGIAGKERLPANVRMGYVPTKWIAAPSAEPDDAEKESVSAKAEEAKAAIHAMADHNHRPEQKITHRHVNTLQMALDAERRGAIMRPDWIRALDIMRNGDF